MGIGSDSLTELSKVSLQESKSSLDKLGEQIIKEKALDVAAQIEIFVRSHPKMRKEDLVKSPGSKKSPCKRSERRGTPRSMMIMG